MQTLTLALSKGRIFDEAMPLLNKIGIHLIHDIKHSRKLILATCEETLKIILVRAQDVPVYVRYGAAQLGIAGLDVLLEQGCEGIYQPISLPIAQCKLVVAAPKDKLADYATLSQQGRRLRVASKYPRLTENHFAKKGVYLDFIKLYGSIELAPLTGLSDVIVDLLETGQTFKANGLVEVELIHPISAQLIVNQTALKFNSVPINAFIQKLRKVVHE
ncbi:MAG: ATP phosphoribosyltransferase [Gammaproteobacteria bacterium]|nr:ATP phosphoribosyltransferase [Gammaproteobacteria bacterium]